MKNLPVSLVLGLIVIGCVAQAQPIAEVLEPDDAISFLVVGDWGRHGEYGQRETANAMATAARVLDIAAVVSTGDNFYPDGVASVHDAAWQRSFEDIYTGHHLYVPWVVAIGNHGYHGSVQAQIDYTKVSQRWTMPSRYYTHELVEDISDSDTIKVLFVVLDTSPFQSAYRTAPDGEYSDVAEQDTAAQKRWLEDVLTKRDPDAWCIVIGHHPMYSGGKRKGETNDMINSFNALLAKYNVDAYFAGHEHDLQHQDDGTGVQYFVSGAGSEVRPTGTMKYTKFARSVGGFAACTATLQGLTIRFVDQNENIIYTTTISR